MRLLLAITAAALLLATLAGRLQAAPEPPGARSLLVKPVLGEEHAPDRWAVVVGISRYQHAEQNLRFAAEDARSVSKALQEHCGFQPDHIKLLLDEEATATNLRSALGTWLPRVAGRGDLVVIYYSGHGSPDLDTNVTEDGIRKYLVTYDADPEDLFGTAVPMDDLSSALLRLRSERTVLLLDSCFSGGALGAAGAPLPRTFHKANQDFGGKITGGFLDTLALSGRGRAVLSACSPAEKSFEYGDLQHGIFTHFLVEGLSGKAASPTSGEVSATDLYEYVYQHLKEPGANRQPQTPMLATSVAGTLVLSGKAGARGSGRGKVRIISSPLGAEVFIDREATPVRTPVERELPQGFHQLSLFRPGYLPLSEEVYVASDQTKLASFVLTAEEKRGDLLVQAPAGASVRVDDREVGVVGPSGLLRVPDVDAGARKLRVDAAGFAAFQREVTVLPGRPLVARVDLQRAVAGLREPAPQEIPARLKADQGHYVWADGSEMLFVPEGPFIMGRDEEEEARPRHQAQLPAFWIDKLEVSNTQFGRFVQMTGYRPEGGWTAPPPERANRPAVRVSLADARAYANWAGKALPTEAQWEKVARGPEGRLYPYGHELDVRYQNIRAYQLGGTLDVGTLLKGASPYGALDLLGNVWEWCDSPFDPYPGNTLSLQSFGKGYGVIRGGSYLTPALKEQLTSATRSFLRPTIGQDDVGFRCVVPVP